MQSKDIDRPHKKRDADTGNDKRNSLEALSAAILSQGRLSYIFRSSVFEPTTSLRVGLARHNKST